MKKKIYSFLFYFLIKKNNFRYRNIAFRSFWYWLWNYSTKAYNGVISFRIHGEKVKIPNGYLYPLYLNTYDSFNYPLTELVYQVYTVKQAPVHFIDIGAAVGDTMLLLFQKCPGMIGYYYCIDGDDEFYELQKYNLRNHPEGSLIKSLLSDKNSKKERELLRTHPGTSSAQGDSYSEAVTLDELLVDEMKVSNIDLIKIDVDGLDGKVISGASELIRKFNPSIIFEFHPLIYRKTGNSFTQPFHELISHGYRKFIFFDKFGAFSHIQIDISDDEIDFISQICLNGKINDDWHYDVVALHDNSKIDPVQLAEAAYSKIH